MHQHTSDDISLKIRLYVLRKGFPGSNPIPENGDFETMNPTRIGRGLDSYWVYDFARNFTAQTTPLWQMSPPHLQWREYPDLLRPLG